MLDGNPMLILKPWLTVKFTLNIISPLYGLIRNSNSFHLILFQDQADISDQKEKQGYDIRKKTNFKIKKKNQIKKRMKDQAEKLDQKENEIHDQAENKIRRKEKIQHLAEK